MKKGRNTNHTNGTTFVYDHNGWIALGMAVIKQTAEDYRMARQKLRNPNSDTRANLGTIRDCENFLRSPYPEFWTGANGKYILRKLREEDAA